MKKIRIVNGPLALIGDDNQYIYVPEGMWCLAVGHHLYGNRIYFSKSAAEKKLRNSRIRYSY